MKLKNFICFLALGLSSVLFANEDKQPKMEPGIYAEIKTSKGLILLELFYKKTPLTVASFVGLAEGNLTVFDTIPQTTPFYNGLKFHRVIKDFMIQGGDPAGNGSGGPKYRFYDEFSQELKHDGPGILSMANSGPTTNGSQFFITHKATPHLDGRHTVFGKVVKGQEVVDAIAQDDVMETVKIIRIGKEAKKWNATQNFSLAYAAAKKNEEEKVKLRLEEEAKQNAYIEQIKNMSHVEFSEYMFNEVRKTFPDVQKSESGLLYIIEKFGEDERPAAGKLLTVHYRGTFRTTGKEFDASYNRGNPIQFVYQQQRMIAGFEEGLSMIGKGGKIKVFIPYFQAYGPGGRPGGIPPYSDLVFDLETIDIGEKAPAHDPNDGHNHDGHKH